jgi:hypothetical protein
MGGIRNAHEILVGKPEEKIPIGKPRRRREDDDEMDLKEIIWMNRIHLTQGNEKLYTKIYTNVTSNFLIKYLLYRYPISRIF